MDSSTSSSVTSLVLSFISNLVKGILAKLATPVKVNYSKKLIFFDKCNWTNISINSKFPPILFRMSLNVNVVLNKKKLEKKILLTLYCKSFWGHVFHSNGQMQIDVKIRIWFLVGKFKSFKEVVLEKTYLYQILY